MTETPEIHAGPAPTARPARGGPLSRISLACVAVGLALVTIGLALVPREATLGENVRMVFFHGAVTWNGIIMAAAAGLLGVFTILSSRLPAWGDARELGSPGSRSAAVAAGVGFVRRAVVWRLLSLATLFWVLSLSLSFPVMIRTWGGVLWNEPKLLMSAEVVSLFLVCWAVSYFVGRPGVTAAAALVSTGVMAALLATTPGAFHPDNPIMGSENLRFIGTFAAILAGLVVGSLGAASVRRVVAGDTT